MRLAAFRRDGHTRLGAWIQVEEESLLVDLNRTVPDIPSGIMDFLSAGEAALALARKALSRLEGCVLVDPKGITLQAPVPRPGKILCLGHNYHDHMGDGHAAPPEYPNVFCKTANTVIGPEEMVVIPPGVRQTDFEGELAVVIGRRARRVSEESAMDHVVGYTAFNDVSAREVQKRGSQWMLGKSLDTFGPMGPVLATKEEVPDPHYLELDVTVNGITRQHASTRDQIFSIPFLIAYLSAFLTLEPGDIIATGTPSRFGAAAGADPFLNPGDRVSISIERIGTLSNSFTAGPEVPR